MAWLPKSKKARRRLTVVAVAGVVLVGAAGLVFYALGDSVSLYETPSGVAKDHIPLGRTVQLGGLVADHSVVHRPDGSVEFTVTDNVQTAQVVYKGDLPDLFREGQGVVTKGVFKSAGVFQASEVLAKHDETYMPRELQKQLKAAGEWRGQGAPPPKYSTASAVPALSGYGLATPSAVQGKAP